jgi:ribosomal protein S18 acetylase RimI-like enzyme
MIKIREMRDGEEKAICDTVIKSFNEFVAPDFSQEGIESFMDGVKPDLITERVKRGNIIIVAIADKKIVGVIEIKDMNHICMFFVDGEYHRQGIGKRLLNHAIKICRSITKSISKITVNSSPYAVHIYEKLGFQKTSEEQIKHGIRFTPMAKKL